MLALVAVGCVKQLPPPPPPAPVAPKLEAAPPPPTGYGRLVVDVVDQPVPVQRVVAESTPVQNARGRTTFRFREQPQVLCAMSPCASDVPAGNVLLGFPVIGDSDALEVELVHIGAEPSVYRRSLSVYEDNTGSLRVVGIVATAVGGTALMTGAALLPIGLAEDHGGLATSGGITLGVGTALLVFGIWAIRKDAPTFRPGSSNHFPLP